MPYYDYKCSSCDEVVEIIKKISDPDPICPVCKKDTLIKNHFAAPSVEYKGKGWFKTDGKY